MLDHNSLNPPAVPFSGLLSGDLYGRDTQQCLQKWVRWSDTCLQILLNVSRYLCEVMGTSESNLLMEEAALMAMMESQAEIRSENLDTRVELYLVFPPTGQPWGQALHQRRASGESEGQLQTLTGPWVRPPRLRRSALPSFLTAKYPGLTFSGYKTI